MHHIGSLAGLAAKALAKQVGDIRLVVYDQDASATRSQTPGRASSHSRCRLCHCRLVSAGQSNGELREITDLAVDADRATMLLGHDVVADREAEAGAFPGRLCREERLEELVLNLGWDADAVIPYLHLDGFAEIPRRYL